MLPYSTGVELVASALWARLSPASAAVGVAAAGVEGEDVPRAGVVLVLSGDTINNITVVPVLELVIRPCQ